MKRGVGHSESNSSGQPSKRRSTRGAALLAAAGTSSSSSKQTSANRTNRRKSSTTNGAAVRIPGAAATAMKQKKGAHAATSSEVRSSPRRTKKAGDAVAPQQQGGAVSSTATPRGATGLQKRAASSPSPTAAAAAAGSTPSSSSRAAVAATTSSKKGRGGGWRGKGKLDTASDSDVAMKMLASLLSPVAAPREQDSRPETHQHQVRCAGVSPLLEAYLYSHCCVCNLGCLSTSKGNTRVMPNIRHLRTHASKRGRTHTSAAETTRPCSILKGTLPHTSNRVRSTDLPTLPTSLHAWLFSIPFSRG